MPETSTPEDCPKRYACDRCHSQKLRCPRVSVTGDTNECCMRCRKAGKLCSFSRPEKPGRPSKKSMERKVKNAAREGSISEMVPNRSSEGSPILPITPMATPLEYSRDDDLNSPLDSSYRLSRDRSVPTSISSISSSYPSYPSDDGYHFTQSSDDLLVFEDSKYMMDIVMDMRESNPKTSDFLDKMNSDTLFEHVDWSLPQMPSTISFESPARESHQSFIPAQQEPQQPAPDAVRRHCFLGGLLDLNKKINTSWKRLETGLQNTEFEGEYRETILREAARCSEDLFYLLQRLDSEVEQPRGPTPHASPFDHRSQPQMLPQSDMFPINEVLPQTLPAWISSDDGMHGS